MGKYIVAPSLLSADFSDLKTDIKKAEEAGADWLHYDVMDGVFVDNISFGFPILNKTTSFHKMVNDVHLMISNPYHYIKRFADAGADYITFHLEACEKKQDAFEVLDLIHKYGKKAGISIKPNTPVEDVLPFLYSCDLVLIMSVEPGFGGQKFDDRALNKIAKLRAYIDHNEIKNVLIEVDGGINDKTSTLCKICGVDVLVAGSYLFGKDDMKERIEDLKK